MQTTGRKQRRSSWQLLGGRAGARRSGDLQYRRVLRRPVLTHTTSRRCLSRTPASGSDRTRARNSDPIQRAPLICQSSQEVSLMNRFLVIAGLALTSLAPLPALAHSNVSLSVGLGFPAPIRSEERRVGKEWVSTG